MYHLITYMTTQSTNIKSYNKWVWRDGSNYQPIERSYIKITKNNCQEINNSEQQPQDKTTQQNQQNQPPETIENTPDTQFIPQTNNKREDTYSKMAEREMIKQVGMNPFLNNSYVDGINIRDQFLIPYHESKPKLHSNEL